jgi:hypothetical protein
MSFEDSMREIESHEFAAHLGVANDTSMFFELAEQQRPVIELIKSLGDKTAQKRLLLKIFALLRQQEDVRYRNSRDAAIAVYLNALLHSNKKLATLAATEAISSPRLWWTKKIASLILSRSSKRHHLTSRKFVSNSQWSLQSPKNRKDFLIVDIPSGAWIQSGNVIDADKIEVRAGDGGEKVNNESTFSVNSAKASGLTVNQSND